MAKELPYFRFTVQEWQNGDIAIESYELKGLFIDVCGFYWMRDCSIDIAMLEKRFKDAKDLLKQLIDIDVLKLSNNNQININFLDEQFDLLSEKRLKRQLAGKKGGLAKSSNAKAMLKQNSSYKDNNKDKDNNNKAFVADANKDEKHYRKYLFDLVKEKQSSRDILFKNNSIDLTLRNHLWESFIENAILNTPLIEDGKHAWNTFKKYVQDNGQKYKIKESNFEGFE
jgi:hypothetical protein